MPTIADNVRSMAQLVSAVKKEYHLTESTVLRIVDMSFALAEQGRVPEDEDDELLTDPETGEPIMFPFAPEDIDAVEETPEPDDEQPAAITTPLEN